MDTGTDGMASHDELREVIASSGANLPPDLDDDTSLIRSGLLDSMALFNLALWVEERVTPGLDLTSFDLSAEWDTLRLLRAFLARHGKALS
jgi:acyl carrier protein